MKPTLVTLHAHPDDEAIFTGGTIIRAVEAGWRVVLVVATDGDLGTSGGASRAGLAARRRAETRDSAALLGIDRIEFLGHGDSGYRTASHDGRSEVAVARGLEAGTLASAHVDRVAAVVRRILIDEQAVALTSYDDNGVYGHIDHVQVHEIAVRSVAGTGCALLEATLDRSALRQLRSRLVTRGLVDGLWPTSLVEQLGVEPGPDLVPVDVSAQLERKLCAVAAHSSQVMDADSFMGLPPGVFHHLLGTEWFRVARPGDGRLLTQLQGTRGARSSTGSDGSYGPASAVVNPADGAPTPVMSS